MNVIPKIRAEMSEMENRTKKKKKKKWTKLTKPKLDFCNDRESWQKFSQIDQDKNRGN